MVLKARKLPDQYVGIAYGGTFCFNAQMDGSQVDVSTSFGTHFRPLQPWVCRGSVSRNKR